MITKQDLKRFNKEINTRKPIGPFACRDNSKDLAKKIGWNFFGFRDYNERHGAWVYYTIPPEMDETFSKN